MKLSVFPLDEQQFTCHVSSTMSHPYCEPRKLTSVTAVLWTAEHDPRAESVMSAHNAGLTAYNPVRRAYLYCPGEYWGPFLQVARSWNSGKSLRAVMTYAQACCLLTQPSCLLKQSVTTA